MALSVPSSLTFAAPMRPVAHRVSSAGAPVTVTTGVPRRAIIRNSGASPGPPSAPSSFRANSTPTGTFRRVNLAIRSRSHSVSDRPWLISRGFQSGAARRTSSWCTKNSTVLASSSSAEMDHGDSRGGPLRIVATRAGNGLRAICSCTRAV